MPNIIQPFGDYQNLLLLISETYTTGQTKAAQAVNTTLLTTYRQIGQHIVEFGGGVAGAVGGGFAGLRIKFF